MFSEQIYNDLICKSKDLIGVYECKISDNENEIEKKINSDDTLDEVSKKVKEIVIILREVKYNYDGLISEYDCYSNKLLVDHKEIKIKLFDSNISVAPSDEQFIIDLDAYFMKKIGQKMDKNSLGKDRILFYENMKKDINNLTEAGRLDYIWRNICEEIKTLFIVWENLKRFPKVLYALQKWKKMLS